MTMLAFVLGAALSLHAAAAPSQSEQPRSFKVAKGGKLDMTISQGDIRVAPWDREEVAVRVRGADEDYMDELRITQEGSTVTIRDVPGWSNDADIKFEINVPAEFNLDLETRGGKVDVAGAFTGRLSAHSAGGDMRTGDVKGTVEIETSGGDIRTGDVTGAATLETAGGDIAAGTIGGEADIRTSGGEIMIERAAKGLTAHTAGGDVSVGDVGGTASVTTAGGDIALGRVAGSARLKTAGGNISLRSADGEVAAQTSGGDIRLDSVAGSVDARTAAGNIIVLLIPSGKEPSRLSTSVGDVRLYLPADARASVEARMNVRGRRWSEAEGSILSDFEAVRMDKNREDREIHATYTVNGGGPVIGIDVSMGNIEIRKADRLPRTTEGRRKRGKE